MFLIKVINCSATQLALAGRGGEYYFVMIWGEGGGFLRSFPHIFEKKIKLKVRFKGLKSKKGNFQLLNADLAVYVSSIQIVFLVFLTNLYFQHVKWSRYAWVNSLIVCVKRKRKVVKYPWFNYRFNHKKLSFIISEKNQNTFNP